MSMIRDTMIWFGAIVFWELGKCIGRIIKKKRTSKEDLIREELGVEVHNSFELCKRK